MVNHFVLLQGNSFSVKPDQMQVGADSPALRYSEVEMKRTGFELTNYESPHRSPLALERAEERQLLPIYAEPSYRPLEFQLHT